MIEDGKVEEVKIIKLSITKEVEVLARIRFVVDDK